MRVLHRLVRRLGSFWEAKAQPHAHNRRVPPPPPRARLDLEELGARITPTVYYASPGESPQVIQARVDQLQPGDEFVFRAGTYSGVTVDLHSSGTPTQGITIRGEGDVVFRDTSQTAIDTQGNDYIRIETLSFTNVRTAVEVRPGSHNVTITSLDITGADFAILLGNRDAPQTPAGAISDVIISDVVATGDRNNGPRGDGIRAEGDVSTLVLERLTISGFAYTQDNGFINGDGVILESGVRGVTIRDVTSFNNGDAGFDIKADDVTLDHVISHGNQNNFKGWGNRIAMSNSLLYDPTTNAINLRNGDGRLVNTTIVGGVIQLAREVSTWPAAQLRLDNCIVARQSGGTWVTRDSGTQLIENHTLWFDANTSDPATDPLFVNWAGHDFRLREGSPAIDAGDAGLTTSQTDLDGEQRIRGASVDLGAFEFQTGAAQMMGLTNGQMVSGTIFFGPDPSRHPDVRKAVYYLNGTQYGRVYSAPFYWGGPSGNGTQGFDTRTLVNGTYTISGYITTKAGDIQFAPIQFTVANGSTGQSGAQMVGLTNGQAVSGVIYFGPDLNQHPDVRKAAYYLNGAQYGRVYQAPFYWGGPNGDGTQGFDTRTLPNGTYTLSGYITTSLGDISFTAITFTVSN